jgi:hypothetical protein
MVATVDLSLLATNPVKRRDEFVGGGCLAGRGPGDLPTD